MLTDRLKSLNLILERMNVLYVRAVEILEKEKHSLILFDYEELYKLFREKDEVLTAIRALDKDRLKIQDLFAILNNKNSSEVTLQSMAEHLISLGGDSALAGNRLLALRKKLNETIENLRHKIELNQSFVEKSITNLQSIAEHFSSAVTGRDQEIKKTSVYTGKGKFDQPNRTSGGLLEKRL